MRANARIWIWLYVRLKSSALTLSYSVYCLLYTNVCFTVLPSTIHRSHLTTSDRELRMKIQKVQQQNWKQWKLIEFNCRKQEKFSRFASKFVDFHFYFIFLLMFFSFFPSIFRWAASVHAVLSVLFIIEIVKFVLKTIFTLYSITNHYFKGKLIEILL